MKWRVSLPVLSVALFAPLFVVAPQTSLPAQSADSYAVYSVVVPQIQQVAQPKYLIANQTVPYAHTKSQFPVEPENLATSEEFDKRLATATRTEWLRIRKSQPCVLAPAAERERYWSAMGDYRRKNVMSEPLERRLDLPEPYEWVSVSAANADDKIAFAERNGAYGLYELSAVGFSSDMTTAIVYVGFDCPLCGRWALHVLQKKDGKWQEVALGCSTMS